MKELKTAIYNKESKVLMSLVDGKAEHIDETLFLTRELILDEDKEQLEGDYDTFKIVPFSEAKAEITEEESDKIAGMQIQEKYKIHTQINILSEALESVITKLELTGPNIDTFVDMRAEIQNVIDTNNKIKERVATLPEYNYVSKEDVKKKMEAQAAGGLQHLISGNTAKL